MMVIKAKYLEVKELPATDDFSASTLVTVLVGTESISLVGGAELFGQLNKVQQLMPLLLELRWRRIDLASYGGSGKGKAFRLRALRLLDPKELAA